MFTSFADLFVNRNECPRKEWRGSGKECTARSLEALEGLDVDRARSLCTERAREARTTRRREGAYTSHPSTMALAFCFDGCISGSMFDELKRWVAHHDRARPGKEWSALWQGWRTVLLDPKDRRWVISFESD